jgi:hypothetical protein
MVSFCNEILDGLTEIPVSGSPGCMLVVGKNAQAILTNQNSNDVFLAASELDAGRIFVAGHTCYGEWLFKAKQKNHLQTALMNNVTKWLTRSDRAVDDDEILDVHKASTAPKDWAKYKIAYWSPHNHKELSESVQGELLEFLSKGGALFCCATTWAYLNYKKCEQLKDHEMFQFLKTHAGIVLTNKAISAQNPLSTAHNKAKSCNFEKAMSKLCSNMFEYKDSVNTVIRYMQELNEVIEPDQNILKSIKDSVLSQCDDKHICPFPTKNKAVNGADEKLSARLLSYCYLGLVAEKAPGIQTFPGDFESPPELLNHVEIHLRANFQERLSTGFYLPAGVCLTIKVLSGSCSDWKVRIGAHTDNISKMDDYKRWPVVSFEKILKPRTLISSSFGGLIYFDYGTRYLSV